MYYLRVVRNRSVFTPAGFDLAKAAKSLADRGGGHASVYRVFSEAEAERVALLFAMHTKPGPEDMDFVLIPFAWLDELGVTARPDPHGIDHPALRETHFELHGLDVAGVCEQLAAKFNGPEGLTRRLKAKAIATMAKAELDTDVNGYAAALIKGKQHWLDRISEIKS